MRGSLRMRSRLRSSSTRPYSRACAGLSGATRAGAAADAVNPSRYNQKMLRKTLAAVALLAGAAGAVVLAQDKPAQKPADKKPEGVLIAPQAPREIIRRSVDLVTNTVIVRDAQGQFVANLGKNDSEVLEHGVKQNLITFVLTHGAPRWNDV